jgi:hypothetical protein
MVAVAVALLFFLALAGADLLVSSLSSDDLSHMGVQKKR